MPTIRLTKERKKYLLMPQLGNFITLEKDCFHLFIFCFKTTQFCGKIQKIILSLVNFITSQIFLPRPNISYLFS